MLNSYWEYAGTRYKHKFKAIEASHGDIHGISYHLFENSLSNYDWSTEPAQSFKSLMLQRALQLRDQYSYLKFCFSGGADSTTALNVFLSNNIHLDEIVVWRFGNNLSNYEIDEYALPFLKNIKSQILNTKITVYTYEEDYYKKYLDDSWFFTKNSLCPRHPYLPKIKGKNFCYIFAGIDPLIEYIDGKYFATFYDTTGTGELAPINNIELFYTTPNLPELHAKQVYTIKQHLKPNFTLEDQKAVLRKYLRDKPIAPTPDFLSKDWGNIVSMHFQKKTTYIHREMGKFFTDQYRYILNTKINGRAVYKSMLGYCANKFCLGE